MSSKKYFIELPPLHTELADQDKAEFREVRQWRYEQDSHGAFLDRDGVLRRSVRDVEPEVADRKFTGMVIGLCLIVVAMFVALDQGYFDWAAFLFQ